MVARNTNYEVIVSTQKPSLRHSLNESAQQDLLPWADPYIARLVKRLQAEVRRERAERARMKKMQEQLADELAPPYIDRSLDLPSEETRWPLLED